jgi:hypothetical protein
MAPFFQQLLDLITQFPANRNDFLPALELFTAVEAEDGPRIAITSANIGKMDVNFPAPVALLKEEVVDEALKRLLLLGEEAAVTAVIEWFAQRKTFAHSPWDRRTELWAGAIDSLPESIPRLSPREADQTLTRVVSASAVLLKRHAEAVAVEGGPEPYRAGEIVGGFGNAPYSPGRRTDVLAKGITRLSIDWMALHQQMLDAAMGTVAASGPKRFDALLALRDRWIRETGRSFRLPLFAKRTPWADILIAVNRLKPGNAPHHTYQDAFLPYQSRTYGFTPYDRDDRGEPVGKKVWLVDLLEVRDRQLYVPLDEFGAPYRFVPTPTTQAERDEEQKHLKKLADRRKILERAEKSGAKLALGSEDDLARLACGLYTALTAASGPTATDAHKAAWSDVLAFLSRYLSSWSTHAEFNMDEDENYFGRLFPRSEAGGVIHDCGVYAVRMAYVFLSLAECAKPPNATGNSRVSFLLLPLHVGLLVEIAGFEAIVLHNHVITRIASTVLDAAEKEWKKNAEKDDPSDAEGVRQRLLEDIAAQLFLRDVDMPMRREALPPMGSPPSKTKIWQAYQKMVVQKIASLFSAEVSKQGEPGYQFDTRFLEVLTAEKRWHDRVVVPFWNEAAPAKWRTLGGSFSNRQRLARELDDEVDRIAESYGLPQLKENETYDPPPLPSCLVGLKQRPVPAKATSQEPSSGQAKDAKSREPTQAEPKGTQKNEIRPMKDALTKDVRAHRKTWIGNGAQRVTVAKRLAGFATGIGPVGQVNEYVQVLCAATGPKLPVPPFAAPIDRLIRFGD